MEVLGSRSYSYCYSAALSDQTGGGNRIVSQFLLDNFNPFLNASLNKFQLVSNKLSNIGGFTLNPR